MSHELPPQLLAQEPEIDKLKETNDDECNEDARKFSVEKILMQPSHVAKRRRSSFSVPKEEQTGKYTLPNASNLKTAENILVEEEQDFGVSEDVFELRATSFRPSYNNPKVESKNVSKVSSERNSMTSKQVLQVTLYESEEEVDLVSEFKQYKSSSIVPKDSQKKEVIKRDPTPILLDATILTHSDQKIQEISEFYQPKNPSFGKASTGRLALKMPKHAEKSSGDSVMLIGKKLKKKIIEVKKPKQKERKEADILETLYIAPVHEEVIPEVPEEVVNDTVPQTVISSPPKKEEISFADIGMYQDISEVDAVMSHFAALLETRKENLQKAINERKNIADSEVLIVLNEIRQKGKHEQFQNQAVEKQENVTIIPDDNKNTSNMKNVAELEEKVRPISAVEIRRKSDISLRNIQSASTSTRRSLSTRETFSTCTCSCSTGSCSECVSRGASAQSSRLESSKDSAKINNPFSKLKFAKYEIHDSFGQISLLELPPPPIAKPEIPKQKSISVNLFEDKSLNLENSETNDNIELIISGSHLQKKEVILKSNIGSIETMGTYPSTHRSIIFDANGEKVSNEKRGPKIPSKGQDKLNINDFGNILQNIPDILVERALKNEIPKSTPRRMDFSPMISQTSFSSAAFKEIITTDVYKNESKSPNSSLIDFPIQKIDLSREDSLDLQVQQVIQQYEMKKLKEQKKIRKRNSPRRKFISHRKKDVTPKNKDTGSGFETEEELTEPKPLPSRAKALWQLIKKDIQKKKLINSLRNGDDKLPSVVVSEAELGNIQEAMYTTTQPKSKASEVKIDPKIFYLVHRRAFDIEKYPEFYAKRKIDPVTNDLEDISTRKPIIGISAEANRARLLADDDSNVIHQFLIRHGLLLNGFVTGGVMSLYECVHAPEKRKVGLTGLERVKYPTFDDPGPPLDATGTPVLDETAIIARKEPPLTEEIQKIDVLINESSIPVPAYHRKRGMLFARMEKFNRAMEDLDIAIQFDPFNSDGLWHRHQLYLRYNDAASALQDLDNLTENNKVHLAAFQAKARIYQAIGMYKLAIINYSTIIRLRSDNADAYFNRACLFEIDDEITFANEDFRSVRILDPSNNVAIHNLAMYSFQKQLWSDCISEFTKLIHVHPENADYYMYRGRSYAAMSFFVEALEDLTRAVRLEPDHSAYYFHRACLLREQNPVRAIQDLSVSIMLDETIQNSDAYFHRAQLYQKLKQNELAIQDYLASVAINPKKSKALLNLGILYMRYSKNYTEALNYINRAIMTDPINLKGYISRGELYEAMYREAMLKMAATNHKRTMRANNRMDNAANYVTLAIKDYSRAIHIRPSNYLLFLYRGKMLLKQGKVEEATADFHTAFDLNSSIAQTFIQRTLILSFQRKYRQIIEEYEERKREYKIVTDEPALLLLVAKARIRDGDFIGALQDLTIASGQSRDDPQISLQKGICFEYLKNWQEASEEFSKCLQAMPTFTKAYYHRGICKLAVEDDTGLEDLDKAIELEPKYFDVYITRAAFYESKNNYFKAIADCDEALKIEPVSIRAHILRGSCRTKLGHFQMAATDFSKAISIDKSSHFAFYSRAIAHQAACDYLNAIKDYSIVIMLEDYVDAFKNRALLYWEIGDNENALMDFIEAKRLVPGDAKIRSLLGLSFHKVGRFQESCDEYTEAINLDGKMIEAILGRGNVYAQLGNLQESRKDYCRVLHMYPKSADTLVNIAYTYQSENNMETAWKYFTMAFTVDNKCTAALEGRALVNLKRNNAFAAYLDICSAIKIAPRNPQFLTNRGVIFEALNDDISALQSYKIAMDVDKEYSLAYYNAANLYLKQHSWEKAIDYYTISIKYEPNDPTSFMNRGLAYSMLKSYENAKKDLEEAISLDPTMANAYFNLGCVLKSQGDSLGAEAAFAKVIEISPGDSIAYQLRAETRTKQLNWQGALDDYAAQIAVE